MWTRFLTTLPKYIPKQFPTYNIMRLGTESPRENSNTLSIKDQTLMVNLGSKDYEFTTYN